MASVQGGTVGSQKSWIGAIASATAVAIGCLAVLSDLGEVTTNWHKLIRRINAGLGLPAESPLTRVDTLLLVLCVLVASLLVVVVRRHSATGSLAEGRMSQGPLPSAEERARIRYLRWFKEEIDNKLKASENDAVLLDLGLEETTGKTRPWTYPNPGTRRRVFTSIDQAFDAFDGRLLILGAPGAGKSTALLTIASRLLRESQNDADAPLPVLLNLSSFEGPRRPAVRQGIPRFESTENSERPRPDYTEETPDDSDEPEALFELWLVNQLEGLRRIHGIGELISRLYRDDRIAFLLDGLDEVDEKRVAEIVQVLNAFFGYRSAPAVVCSRSIGYDKLLGEGERGRLLLQGAVTLQSVAPAQIHTYLNQADAAGLRDALAGDEHLYELARTPLTLSVMVSAYRDRKSSDLPVGLSVIQHRDHLFASYVSQMMQRQVKRKARKPTYHHELRQMEVTPYSLEEVYRYLGWLAVRLSEGGRTEFLASRLAAYATTGSTFFGEFRFRPVWEGWPELKTANFLVTFILSSILCIVLLSGSGATAPLAVGSVLAMPALAMLARWRHGRVVVEFLGAIIIPFAAHLAIAQALAAFFPHVPSPVLGLLGLVLPFIVFSIFRAGFSRSIRFVFTLLLSMGLPIIVLAVMDRLDLAAWAISLGMALGISIDSKSHGNIGSFGDWLLWGLGLALGVGYGHWVEGLPPFLPALVVAQIFWISFASLGEVVIGLGLATGSLAGLLAGGAPGAVLGGLVGAAFALRPLRGAFINLSNFIDRWLRQPLLRLILQAQRHLPLRFKRFLSYSVEAMLLKRSGDGYEFVHKLLRAHFAVRYLKPLLCDERGKVRLGIVDQLARQGDSSSEILRQLVDHPDQAVSKAAAASLRLISAEPSSGSNRPG